MFDLIPLLVILAGFTIIIIIVVRKFPALAALDVATIRAEQEIKFKEQIIGKKLKRSLVKWSAKFYKLLKPIGAFLSAAFKWLFDKLNKWKDSYKEKPTTPLEARAQVERLIAEAEELDKKNELEESEKRLIEAIGLDSKSLKAFKFLGQVYFKKKNLEEAKETFRHILKLLENEESEYETKNGKAGNSEGQNRLADINVERSLAYYYLSLINRAAENLDEALENIKKSLAIEPNNPQRLDTCLEISIIKKDKNFAQEAYERLAVANPENQKLPEFKARIEEL